MAKGKLLGRDFGMDVMLTICRLQILLIFSRKNHFRLTRGGFLCRPRDKKVGIAVFRRSSITLVPSHGDRFGEILWSTEDCACPLWTDYLSYHEDSGIIEHNINTFAGCTGAIIFFPT
jgi:hypothetical protein